MKSQFTPPTSLKLLVDVLIDSIQLETTQRYTSFLRRLEAVLEENGGKTFIKNIACLIFL